MSHTFEVDGRWDGKFSGTIQPQGTTPVAFGVPPEFGGPGGEWTPEHFLAAAVSSCIQATFLMIARASKTEISSYEAKADCTMAKTSGGFEVTGITVSPKIVVADDDNRAQAERAIDKAEQLCPISKALGELVTVNPQVKVNS